ncbi:UBX-domain-containing protein [Saitoella complicata NRRL Y-17804]|uniref:UBX domain-containing protein n=1 Tax=Saitoella complicata (strain BCRC 22490 / CBS 7301 / JCM 7358 / NBRC 10748 / NRRL Y-17804) TaxID=698492 RepID=A0A0E9NKB2_SAICN|nr:UBX-domain-containing protein [Saitoella complicata NRRL Y-17804]ODQ54505.1 UBX-domain-containing protein [Saitoella complicata NRRL Y-17804]GAO50126.1 hypothetical protein G7K_4261-t1 [Saitoella complicata NRRL Y-17804]
MDDLDNEQRRSLELFQAVTQIDDVDAAVARLSSSDWSVERAVAGVYDAPPPVSASAPTPTRTAPIASSHNSSPSPPPAQPGPAPSHPLPRQFSSGTGLPQPSPFRTLLSVLFFPFTFLRSFAFFLAGTFPFLGRLLPFLSNTTPRRLERRNVSPRDLADRFIRSFEETYGSAHVSFHADGYSAALAKAKEELKFMLVVLQSEEHDDTIEFNQDTLCNPEVIQFAREQSLIVWAGSISETEGYEVANTLRATRYPFIALLAPTGSRSLSVLLRLEGPVGPSQLLASLTNGMAKQSTSLNRLRAEAAERNAARELRQQQDDAYEASLRRDRERASEAEERRAEEERKKREEEERATEEEERKAKRDQWRKWKKIQMPAEPAAGNGAARISLRMLDGSRIVRRFGAETTLEDLYAFVETYSVEAEEETQKPEGYEHAYDFRLATPMPRKVLDVVTEGQKVLKDEKSLYPSGNLVVEELDEEED